MNLRPLFFFVSLATTLVLAAACAPAALPTPTPVPKAAAPTATPVPKPTPTQAPPYYAGKTIRFIVGYSPGGGFDTYTRLIAKHIGKQIPGNPTATVENMPGAGSLIAANYMYKQAKPDGLTVGNWGGALVQQQLLGAEGIEFDAPKFGWVGLPAQDHSVCAATKASGFTSWEQVMAAPADKPLILGGEAPGTSTTDIPRVLKAALGAPIKLVEGYGGTADMRRAAEAGEVQGVCFTWQSIKVTWKDALAAGNVKILIQAMPEKHRDLANVPTALEFAKTDEARFLLKAVSAAIKMLRPYTMPPNTPKEQLEIIRKAFMDTMKDKEFLAEAEKAGLEIEPLGGEELEKLVKETFNTPPDVVKKLKEVLVPK